MAQVSENWRNACLTDVRKWFSDTLVDFQSMIGTLYNSGKADGEEEYDMTYSGLGNFKLLNGSMVRDTMTEEYKTTYSFPEWAQSIDIKRKLWDDRRDRTIMNMAAEMGLSYNRTKEAHAAEPFNYAFTATGTYSSGDTTALADAKALCATDHPSKASSTYAGSNKGTTAMAASAVSTMRDQMRDITDGRGNKSYLSLDTLLVPADKDIEEVAWEIINTAGKVDVTDNNRNFHKGRYSLAVWMELTNHKNWFGIDSKKMKMYLNWFTRIPLETHDTLDEDAMVLTFGAYERHGFGIPSWRWLVGNQVA
jgi:hypothetical protein